MRLHYARVLSALLVVVVGAHPARGSTIEHEAVRGISTGLLVAGGVVAAGAGVAVAVASAGGDEGGSDGGAGGPQPSLWDITFNPSFDTFLCTGEVHNPNVAPPPNSTFGGGAFETDAGGNFDFRLPNVSQDILRLTGRATDTTFTAQMSCLSGRASTTLSATGSGSRFTGS
jgi:hypothetical protein